MKKIKLFVAALGLMGAMTVNAQTDVTATYLTNADFSQGTPITVGTCTYEKDMASNGTQFSQLQAVAGWDIPANGDARAGGLVAFGSGVWIGGPGYVAPISNADGDNVGNILGIVGVWTATAQYTQTIATLPAGTYTLVVPVYNSQGGTTAIATNLIGANGVYASTKQYPVNTWKYEFVSFTLAEDGPVTVSLGYTAANSGSGAMPHLFISGITLFSGDVDAASYEAAKEEARQAKVAKLEWDAALAEAKAALENADYVNVTGSEKSALEAEVAKAEPTTKDGYNEATVALNAAKDAFVAAKYAYDLALTVPTLAYAGVEKPVVSSETVAADLLTAIRAYYESHAKAEGVDGAVDMTDHINAALTPNNSAWTWTGNKNDPKNNESWTDANGNASYSYYDGGNWSANSWTTTMKQTVDVPAGKYLLTAKGRAAVNTTMTMAVGEDVVTFPSIGAAVGTGVFNRGWNDASVEFTTEGDPIEILVTASTSTQHEWFSICDFRLVQLEAITVPLADEADYEDLASAIETAEAKVLGFEEGEYAPYNNVEALAALAAAKAIDPAAEEGNKQERVQNLTTALNEAVWTANTAEVNAIFDGQFATTEAKEGASGDNVVLPGWTTESGNTRQLLKDTERFPSLVDADANAAVFVHPGTYTYGKIEGYTMPLKAATDYMVSVKYCAWQHGSNNNFSVVVKDANGQVVDIKAYAFGKVEGGLNEEGSLHLARAYFTAAEDGNYTVSIVANGNSAFTDVELVKANYEEVALSEDEVVSFEVSGLPVNVTVARPMVAGEWAAVALPFAANVAEVFGEGAQVAEFQGATETTLSFATSEAETLVAGVPYLVKVAEDKDVLTAQNVVLTEELSTVENLGEPYAFVPVINGQFIDAGAAYVAHGNLIKTLVEPSYIKGFRGIFYKNATEEVVEGKLTLVVDGETTGIATISAQGTEVETGAVYNMAGQRVNKAQKGVYIVNGKKVVLK